MRFVSDQASAMIDRILAAKTDDFTQLVFAAGLLPTRDFRNALLRDVDFGNCDLDAFDFTGASFESCRFDGALIAGARFEGASFKGCGLFKAADWRSWAAVNSAQAAGPIVQAPSDETGGPGQPLHARETADAIPPGSNKASLKGRNSGPGLRQWHIRCLCEIASFAMLRRRLGELRADRLVIDVAEQISALFPDMRVATAGRAMLEIAFERETPEVAAAEIDRLRKALLRAIDINGQSYQFQIHFGAAAAPSHESDEVRLAEAAEAALDQARDEGRVVMLDLSLADLAVDTLNLMHELPRAMAEGEMFLQYQPKVHIRRHEIASADALIRWQHPVHGLILPDDFVSVAERAGEIGALTLWTLRRVIEDQRKLAASGHDLTLFIDIPGVLLADPAFVAEACAIIVESGARIGLEFTETAVIRDPESAIRHMQAFADIGVALAIGDYGAGLSSLAYLKQIPARELKIDKMFVTQLTSSNRDPLIVRSTIDLAHALEMEVTAEGVETQASLALLTVMGCDMVQGFLISRPLGFEAFRDFLIDSESRTDGFIHPSFVRPESFWKRA